MNEIPWFVQAGGPVLTLLLAIPLTGMALAWLVRSARQAYLLGLAGSGLELALAGWIAGHFRHGTANLQFVEHIPLTPFLSYHLGVDGISLLFVLLTALLTLLVILYGEIVHERPAGLYIASVFAFEATLMGLFLSIDVLEFWIVSVLELIPASFILTRWGLASSRRLAALRYLQHAGLGLGLTLVAVLLLGWRQAASTGDWSFALTDLLAHPLHKDQQALIFVLLLLGLAPRLALFPFHAWLPAVAQHGPLATLCVFLVGLKVGIYALFRFVLPLAPHASDAWKEFVVTLAILGIFYGALLALMQINLRRLLAYAAVSHAGMLTVGVFCLNREGLQGSLILTVNFGMAAAGLLFATGVLFRATRTALLPRLGGLFDAFPLLGLTFLLAALSTMAMPGTPGFDAAHLMLEGAIATHPWAVAVAVASGSVASAAFLLWAFQRAFLARRRDRALHPTKIRLNAAEFVLAGTVCAVLLVVGFYTQPWLELVDGSLTHLAGKLDRR
ncbi:NuoM family protein [Methylococcus sp. EFPC2]|uniref:complex I subunit 4 family protein n=1 Tax=Methylococcus sp. EFPC2 TaxID=2812648 RepID=UPI001967EE73|nr:NADH-quinone oxidoreductase subunit M [Methylococcus sp. EFPC2]QSA98280.1 NADH-quinone oxidoreductase subunit M [Methylococcus sp. EFPC2]